MDPPAAPPPPGADPLHPPAWGPGAVASPELPPAGGVVGFDQGPLPGAGTDCAACGAPAPHVRALPAPDGTPFLLPECGACRGAVDAGETRWLAVGLTAALVALGAGAALLLAEVTLLAVPVTAAGGAGVVVAAAVALALRWPGLAPEPGARWVGPRALACRRTGFAAALVGSGARIIPGATVAARLRVPRVAWAPALVAVGLLVLGGAALQGTVRVLNLGEHDLELRVDGEALVRLVPSAVESPASGEWLSLRAGRRHLEALRVDGTPVFDHHVTVSPWREHLWVPAPGVRCFWVERVAVGAGRPEPTRAPLGGPVAFWELPVIDVWFAPVVVGEAPAVSGGAVTALRHAPCEPTPRGTGAGPDGPVPPP